MQHLAPGAAGEVGAGLQAQLPIESFSTTEKTDAGLLHQVIQIIETLTLQSRGHKPASPKCCKARSLRCRIEAGIGRFRSYRNAEEFVMLERATALSIRP